VDVGRSPGGRHLARGNPGAFGLCEDLLLRLAADREVPAFAKAIERGRVTSVTQPRHPEATARSAALEGRRPKSCRLHPGGSALADHPSRLASLAPQDDGEREVS